MSETLNGSCVGRVAYFIPAWNSANEPAAQNADAMMGTIQGMLSALVHPNQNMEIYTSDMSGMSAWSAACQTHWEKQSSQERWR